MNGKILASGLVAAGLIAGVAMYWLQVYAFYDRLPDTTVLRVTTETGPQPLSLAGFDGIDATSSPLRFRACGLLANPAELAHAVPAVSPDPLIAPGWFDCFDAASIGSDLKRGLAAAFVSEREIQTGVDRLIAVYPDGRVFAWHQLNGTLED